VVDDQEAFVRPAVKPATRVLEVGCGRGLLARRLAEAGHVVTAIDLALPDPRPAHERLTFIEADVRTFDAAPFDAIAFTASLHHVAPLASALDRVYALLAPGGLLVVDDFDLESPDLSTLRWYYDTQEILSAAGLYAHERIDGAGEQDPQDRWRVGHEADDHSREAPLHAGESMVAEIEARFVDVKIARGPYLWRYIARGVAGDRARAIAEAVHAAEERGVVAGTLSAVGLRVTARRPA